MASPTPSLNYIADWLEASQLKQADLVNKLGWSKAKANAVWHRDQRVNEDILNEVAPLVHAEPHELLMPPQRAHEIRQIEAILNRAKKEVADETAPTEAAKVTPIRRHRAG